MAKEVKVVKKSERKEALVKIFVVIVSGFIGYFWSILAGVLALFNWLYTLILGARNRSVAEFIEYYNTFAYTMGRYVSGVSNERPFPFNDIQRISKFKE
jgi:hypothetical protein